MSNFEHVTDNLSAYLDGQLTERERLSVAAHLASCATCRHDLETLRYTVALMRELPALRAPRSFTLSTEQAQRARPWWQAPWVSRALHGATALAMLLVVLIASADLLWLNTLQSRSAPAMQNQSGAMTQQKGQESSPASPLPPQQFPAGAQQQVPIVPPAAPQATAPAAQDTIKAATPAPAAALPQPAPPTAAAAQAAPTQAPPSTGTASAATTPQPTTSVFSAPTTTTITRTTPSGLFTPTPASVLDATRTTSPSTMTTTAPVQPTTSPPVAALPSNIIPTTAPVILESQHATPAPFPQPATISDATSMLVIWRTVEVGLCMLTILGIVAIILLRRANR